MKRRKGETQAEFRARQAAYMREYNARRKAEALAGPAQGSLAGFEKPQASPETAARVACFKG